jgi:large subunit ribosomal protein L19
MNLINEVAKTQIRSDLPAFKSGDTIKVMVRIVENKKERQQAFEGIVMAIRGGGVSRTFTVRKVSDGGIGVERIFALNSPIIASITVIRRGKVRRNKINYLRSLSGKSARIKEKL